MLDRLTNLREKRAQGDDGFTLIELLVVVVIIGILIAIAIPLYLNYTKGSNDKAAQSDLRSSITTLEQCNTDNGGYPTSAIAIDGTTATKSVAACTGNNINVSNNTKYQYYYDTSATSTLSYVAYAFNTQGTGSWYCYQSQVGGTAKKEGSATAKPTAWAAACP